MPASALIHIGVPKSGTTSIQRSLSVARDELRRAGYVYPSFLDRENHLPFAAYASEPFARRALRLEGPTWQHWRDEFRSTFANEVRAAPGRWLISSEHIASHVTHTSGIRTFCELFTECSMQPLDLMVYVRRQDRMAAASHAQWVRDGEGKRFDVERHIGLWRRYDFRRLIETWEQQPEVRSVTVCLYPERAGMPSLIDGLCATLGIPRTRAWRDPQLNRSLDGPTLERLRRANAHRDRLGDEAFRALRTRIVDQNGDGAPFSLSPADSQAIMAAYAHSNAWTLARVPTERRVDGYFAVSG